MIRRSVSLIRWIFLALVISNVCSGPDNSTDSGDDDKVTLVSGGTWLVVPRQVLAARRAAVAAILEAKGSEVVLPDVEGPVLRQLLALHYKLGAPEHPVITPQLQSAADRYGVSLLTGECRRQAATPLSVETAAAAAVSASRHSCKSLREDAIAFIKNHSQQVLASPGWANVVSKWPKEVVEVTQLLFDVPADTVILLDEAKGQRLINAAVKGVLEDLEALLAAGASVGARDNRGSTALHWAAARGDVKAVSRLLEAGADAGARDNRGVTALHWAADGGQVKAVGRLLDAGADAGARGNSNHTALHYASYRGHAEVVGRLLAAGARVDARTGWQGTPLHVAAAGGHAAVVGQLLGASAEHSAVDAYGLTPLHWAAQYDRPDAAAALIRAGADKSARNKRGVTPLDMATSENMRQLLGLT